MAVSSSSGQCQYTFVLSGLAGVGKTAIFKHLKTLTGCTEADRRSPSNDVGGVDCCIYSTVVKGVKCKVTIYDTGGLERYASLTSNYYHRCHAVILVYLNDPDRLDTLTCLNMSIESALSYNKSPDTLLFALWGNNFNDRSAGPMTDSISSLEQHVRAFRENASIQDKLCTQVNPQTGENIKEALDNLISAVYFKYRSKSDSVLTPEEELSNSGDSTLQVAYSAEIQQVSVTVDKEGHKKKGKEGRNGRKCCSKQ